MTNLLTVEISETCRWSRGDTGAFDEAVEQLRQVYAVQLDRFPFRSIKVSIARQDPLDPDEFDREAVKRKLALERREMRRGHN